ncbi:MAG: Do family serine endopeptidase [Rhizomicrobium sp.]
MSNTVFPKKDRIGRGTVAALLLGTAIGVGGTALALSGSSFAAANPPPLSQTPMAPQTGFAPLVARVKAAVVQITTTSIPQMSEDQNGNGQGSQAMPQMPNLPAPFGDFFRHYFQQHPGGNNNSGLEEHALGSGFIIDPAGYIVTNNHVVNGARDVSVTLTDGSKYKARVVGRDTKTDLALLKISVGHSLPYVTFGDSDNEHEGDWVIAVGNPYGLGGTVTAGIVSAHGRDINEGPYDDFLQIDAPINPGNSGGPLFNQSGQVVGIDTAIYSPSGGSVGIGFAIPSNVAKDIVAQLREHGKVARGWLGVQMQPMTATLAKAVGLSSNQGVLVDSVVDGSPAQHASLEQGDVITAYGGKPITSARDLAMAVADTPSGKTVPVTVWRDNHQRAVNVTIGTQQKTQVAMAGSNGNDGARVGMALESLTPDLRSQLNLKSSTQGVVVGQVTDGSRADQSGIRAGDVIERIGGKSVNTPGEVANAIDAAEREKKPAIPLLVVRNGVTAFVGLQLATG